MYMIRCYPASVFSPIGRGHARLHMSVRAKADYVPFKPPIILGVTGALIWA